MKNTIKKGDSVSYSSKFLRSIGDYSHCSASRKAVVESVRELPFGGNSVAALVFEDGQTVSALTSNLALVSRLHLEPA